MFVLYQFNLPLEGDIITHTAEALFQFVPPLFAYQAQLLTNASNFQLIQITSPPVLVRKCLPSKLLIEMLPSLFHNVRLVDKFLPPAVLQHHLQLRESILAFQSTLIIQNTVSNNIAGRCFAYFPFGIIRRPRCVWLSLISQIAYDGQVAFFRRHVSVLFTVSTLNCDLI